MRQDQSYNSASLFSLQGRTALWDSILLLCYKIKIGSPASHPPRNYQELEEKRMLFGPVRNSKKREVRAENVVRTNKNRLETNLSSGEYIPPKENSNGGASTDVMAQFLVDQCGLTSKLITSNRQNFA
ncbi:hypothetical protein FXO38_34912 [Capsicum annuum]|nr:hypothetical protein FXO38_34912 [Capsicum annuum]KAF3637341.1 hypothetical protein FXO37_24970 [Capsicum annuum]